MMTIKIEGLQKLARKLADEPRDIAVRKGMKASAEFLQHWIQRNRLKGPRPQYLDHMTGYLSSHIVTSNVEKEGSAYNVRVGTMNVPYACIHEFGGVIKPVHGEYLTIPIRAGSQMAIKMGMWKYKIGPKKGLTKRPISFSSNILGFIKVKQVKIPPRPFMRPAFEDEGNQNQILRIITNRINEALAKE